MKIFMIRHGKADYSYGDAHNFIGHGHDLAKLSEEYIEDVIKTSKDSRLKEATLIVSSPYTRALQTAAIISKVDRVVNWESKEHLKRRVQDIIKKYSNYECIIFVFHKMAIQSITGIENISPAEIIEVIQ